MVTGLRSCWALLLGMWLMMFGSSLQAALIGVRASIEAFTFIQIGIIFSMSYVGYLIGSILGERLTSRIGHVRVFAAMCALSSTVILGQAMLVDPWIWAGAQLVSGMCFAAMFVVAESWLNDATDNEHRGQILSSYMIVVLLGKLSGFYLLSITSAQSFILFSCVSILISCSVIPMLLSAGHLPNYASQERVSILAIVRISPAGAFVVIASQIFIGAFNGLAAVYAHKLGMVGVEVSNFLALFVLGGLIMQWPIGSLSDRIDRRKIIFIACVLCLIVCTVTVLQSNRMILLICIFLLGGLAHPLYSIAIAHTNDYLRPSQRIAASGTLILMASAGSVVGPMMGSGAMDYFGANGFFYFAFLPFLAMAIWTGLRIYLRDPLPNHLRGDFVPIPTKATQIVVNLDPTASPEPK
ncbi:MAG: MFS transporter [Pseudomonadota bacterium]